MPDLFHFNQDLARGIGAPIGKAWKKAKVAYYEAKDQYGVRKSLETTYLRLDICRNRYQNGMSGIHKAVQPFTSTGEFKSAKAIKRAIIDSITLIEKQAATIEKEVKEKVIAKVFAQIPDLLQGIESWQKWTEERAGKFVAQAGIEIVDEQLKQWLLNYLLPVFIWELTLRRIPAKRKNQKLIKSYKETLQKARDKLKNSQMERWMPPEKYEQCVVWAEQVARTFQRSSSQVEGRNGYLAFVHKANRGMPTSRLQVLTVVHNFDIRAWDGKTPAERLFKQDFPNLFEFVLENVTGFKEPRRFKRKSLKTSAVQP